MNSLFNSWFSEDGDDFQALRAGSTSHAAVFTADAGGSNGLFAETRLWKWEPRSDRLALGDQHLRLTITVCRLICSAEYELSWNKIEHRLFSHDRQFLTTGLRHKPADQVNLSRDRLSLGSCATTTTTGLRIRSEYRQAPLSARGVGRATAKMVPSPPGCMPHPNSMTTGTTTRAPISAKSPAGLITCFDPSP